MTREDAKDLTLSVLVIVVALLVADCVWLHVKCAKQECMISAQAAEIASWQKALEAHLNPPTFSERAKEAYEKAKTATKENYEKAKAATVRQYEKAKTAAAAGYDAVKRKYGETME